MTSLVHNEQAINGGLLLPTGTTADRPSASSALNGLIRYNSDTNLLECVVSGAYANVTTTSTAAFLLAANNLSDVADATTSLTNILPDQSTSAGKALVSNGTVAGWASVTVTAAGSDTQIQYNSSGSLAGFTMSGDATVDVATGIITVTKTNNTAFAASATTDTTNASNISSGTISSSVVSGAYSGITGLGTIASGTWHSDLITGTYGGTGVNNGSNTITLAGNLVTVGANSITFTSTGATSVTLPTSGIVTALGNSSTGSGSIVLAASPTIVTPTITSPTITGGTLTTSTVNGVSLTTVGLATAFLNGEGNYVAAGTGTINSGTANQLAYYASTGTVISGSTALPNGITAVTQSSGDNSTKIATTAYSDSSSDKAYVNFSVSGSTCTILNQYNVTSVTYNGVGDYTINYTLTLGTTNYGAVITTVAISTSSNYICVGNVYSVAGKTATSLRISIYSLEGGTTHVGKYRDAPEVYVRIK